MEFNFSPFRSALLLVLVAGFALMGGFHPPAVPSGDWHDPVRVRKAWTYCVLLYLTGAGCVSVVDHYVGNLDRTNLRLAYILIGVVAMAGSALWIRSLVEMLHPA